VCAVKLLEAASADAALGRMTIPVDITNAIPQGVLLHPRFGVEQVKEDGTTKLRPVDHLSWSPGDAEEAPTKKDIKRESVNGYTIPQEKMRPDTLDKFIAVLTSFVMTVGCIPGLFKVSFVPLSFRLASIPQFWQADVDSAFRRLPIRPDHRWAGGIAFKVNGRVT